MRNFDAEVVHFEGGEPVGALVQVKALDRADALRVIAIVADNEGMIDFEVEDVYEVAA